MADNFTSSANMLRGSLDSLIGIVCRASAKVYMNMLYGEGLSGEPCATPLSTVNHSSPSSCPVCAEVDAIRKIFKGCIICYRLVNVLFSGHYSQPQVDLQLVRHFSGQISRIVFLELR